MLVHIILVLHFSSEFIWMSFIVKFISSCCTYQWW